MQIHCSRCRTAEYTVTLAAAGPDVVDLELGALCATTRFADCLLVKVGVERGDIALTDAAATIVHRIAAETSPAIAVLDGFTRPPFSIAIGPNTRSAMTVSSIDVLPELAQGLRERGVPVHLAPPGRGKSWQADVMESPAAQFVLDLRIGEEPIVWSAAAIGGWNSHCGLLFRP